MSASAQTAPGRKSLILFVHGINSGVGCWDVLLRLMSEDPAITAAFDWKRFEYESKVMYGLFNLRARLPDYDDITAKLDQFICESFPGSYEQLFLVGHSQGGLILQRWMQKVLVDGKGERLKRVREVIFLCTPTLGATLGTGLRSLIFSVIKDPQESRLRVLDAEVAKTRRFLEERVVQTSLRDGSHWTVPVLSIWGQEDNVVSAVAAQASFDNLLTVEGDHSSVLKPQNRLDNRYTVLTGALMNPVGHRHVFEVDRYETTIMVEPLADPSYVARRGARVENKVSDNFGRVTRTATISKRNTCTDLFRFNYLTGPAGFLVASFDEVGRGAGDSAPVNEAPGDMRGRWEKGENDVIYDFRPVAGRTYTYEIQIWSGFDAGRRDVHFHFEGNCRCKEYEITVDLTAYVAKGWTVTQVPRVYIDPANTAEHQIGEQRLPANLQACAKADATLGRWTWVFENLSGGIVDAVWDVSAPA